MADSQFIIDIAASMSGTETLSELDALTTKLTDAGRRSEDFQRAVKHVTSELDAAKQASGEAAAALAQGNDQYKILEREAVRAAKAVERASARGAIPPELIQQAADAKSRLDAYSTTLRRLEVTSEAARAKQDKFSRVLANVNKVGAHADARNAALSQRYEKLGQAVSFLPGPLGSVGQRMVSGGKAAHEMSAAFGSAQVATLAVAAGAAVAVLAVVALTAAMIVGATMATKYALAQADASRSASLSRAAFAALSAETAAGVASFDAVARETGLADAELVSLTKQLRAAKVSAAEMPAALRAAATAEAALGKGGASEFIKRLDDGTASVKDFAREVDDKFGGVVAARLRGLDAQMARASKSWGKLFDGIDLEPFQDALGVILGMFEKGHPLAEAFGLGAAGAIDPIGPMALKAAYAVEAFALGFAIQLTKMYLAIKPALQWIGDLFDLDERGSGLLDIMTKIGSAAAVLAVVFGVALAGAAAAVGVVIGAIVGVFALFAAGIYNVVTAAYDLITGILGVGAFLWDAFSGMGENLMLGFIEGISKTVTAVVDAVRNAVGSAIDAAKSVLGIASPSKVFAEIGDNTVMGFTEAVDDGSADAQGSMAALVAPDAAASAAPAAGASAGRASAASGGRAPIDLSGANFNFYGVKDAETHGKAMLAEFFTQLLEGDAESLNGAEPA